MDPELKGLRRCIAQEFGVAFNKFDGLWADMLLQLVEVSGGPDKEAAGWPKLGTPLGIVETIVPGGVFPPIDPGENAFELKRYDVIDNLTGAEGNYQTYHENQDDADELFLKELDNGYVDCNPDKSVLEERYGTYWYSPALE